MSSKSCEITTILKTNLVSKVERIKNKFRNANIHIKKHNHIHKRAIDWHKYGKNDITSTGLAKEVEFEEEILIEDDGNRQNDKNKTIKFEVANARKKKKGVEEIFLLLTKSHGRSIINEFITNGKKKVSIRDFIRAVDDIRMENVTMDDIAKCWPIFDIDGDGDVSIDEFSYVLANWRHILKKNFSHDTAITKTASSIRNFEDTLVQKYYNAPKPPKPTIFTARPQSSPNKRRTIGVRPIVERKQSNNVELIDRYIDRKIDLSKLYFKNKFKDDNDVNDGNSSRMHGNQLLSNKANPHGLNNTFKAIKYAIDSVKEKRSMLNNGDDQIDIKKLNRGKKFSKLYNFSKYDRRFFNKMKLWIKSEINLTRANFLSTIFHSFNTNDLLYENDIIEPLSNLLSKLNENSPLVSSIETRSDKKNNCQDNYFVRNFKLFRIALMDVDRKCNKQSRITRDSFADINDNCNKVSLLELSLNSSNDKSPENKNKMSIDISESIELHNSYLHKSLSITNPRHFHRKRITSTKKGQHRIYQLAIKEMRKMALLKSDGE